MSAEVKICGIKTPEMLAHTIESQADYVGFVHFAKSPRHLEFADMASLIQQAKGAIQSVVLLVSPDMDLVHTAAKIGADWVQLQGGETPDFCAKIKAQTELKIIKALPISEEADFATVPAYIDSVDMLLFDAKPPKGSELPGGNALSFDWRFLAGKTFTKPWMLAGGLTSDTVAQAITLTQAPVVDVSSGVEASRGVKDPDKIAAFCQAAKEL